MIFGDSLTKILLLHAETKLEFEVWSGHDGQFCSDQAKSLWELGETAKFQSSLSRVH